MSCGLGTKITIHYEILTILLDKPGMRHMMISCMYKPPNGNVENLMSMLADMVNLPDLVKREK